MKPSYSRMTPKKRKARLQTLLQRIDDGHDVAPRDLKLALTEAQYLSFTELWREQKKLRDMEKPEEIKKYEKRLAEMMFLHNKAEGYQAKKKKARGKSNRSSLYNQAEAAFEHALECLFEIISANPELQIWFDRTIPFCADGTVDIMNGNFSYPGGLPQLITSRSIYKRVDSVNGKLTKREIKKAVLEDALVEIGEEEGQQEFNGQLDEEQKALMERMLRMTRSLPI